MKNKMLQSIILLLLTVVTLSVTVFAWFSSSDKVKINEFNLNTSDYSMTLSLTIKKNDEDKKTVVTKEEIKNLFLESKPSDEFAFNLKINFTGNVTNYETRILLYKIEALDQNILDAFYIKEKEVLIDEDENYLEHSKLSDLIDNDSKNIVLIDTLTLNKGDTKNIKFTLVFDEDSELQNKNIKIEALVVEGK